MSGVASYQGALLLGGCLATGLSGVVGVQVVLYLKLYQSDRFLLKALVLTVCALDLAHTSLILSGIWDYLVVHFGDVDFAATIPKTISLTILLTAITTVLVHGFYANRIWRLSKRNLYFTLPVVFFALCRLCSACVTSGELLRLGSLTAFRWQYRWLGALGLALSSLVDILITLMLFFLLQSSRVHSLSLDQVIDSLILYTLEIGSLTCAGTIASMICWLILDHSLAYLSVHFVVGKLYATSLLASLITRQNIRASPIRQSAPVLSENPPLTPKGPKGFPFLSPPNSPRSQLTIPVCVEKTVWYDDPQ